MEQINPINKVTLKDKMKSYTRHPGSLILLLLVLIAAALTVVTLLFLVDYILISGIPYLKPSLFALHYNSDNVSMLPAIINPVATAARPPGASTSSSAASTSMPAAPSVA